jgi:hypothetical protein
LHLTVWTENIGSVLLAVGTQHRLEFFFIFCRHFIQNRLYSLLCLLLKVSNYISPNAKSGLFRMYDYGTS